MDVGNVAMRTLLPACDWVNHSFAPNAHLAANLLDGSFELQSLVGAWAAWALGSPGS